MSETLITNLTFLAPVVLFFAAISFFFLTNAHRKKIEGKQRFAEVILKGNRRRSTGMTREEMKSRLMREEEQSSGAGRSIQKLFEAMLRIVNFDKEATRKNLIRSGDRDPRALSRYIMQRGMGMIVGPVLLYMCASSMGLAPVLAWTMSAVGILAGGILVDVLLDKAVAARHAKIQSELPVLLDLLCIHVAAGASFDVALARAANDLKQSFPVAAEEIMHLRRELETSVDREASLQEFASLMNTMTAKTFVAIVSQSERRGNAISEALRGLARESRKDAMIMIERKAQKIPTLMQLPMFTLILPAIFAAVIAPAIFAAMSLM